MAKVHLLTTGGTIGGTWMPSGEVAPGLTGAQILARAQAPSDIEVAAEDFLSVASAAIGFDSMLSLSARVQNVLREDSVDGVVITHGTGTLEQTAYFLDVTMAGEMPVVLTGAMRNPTLPSDDGPLNLTNAIEVAASPRSRGMGVLVVMNGRIHLARDVTKMHSMHFDAFQSPEFGPIGSVDERTVFYARRPFRRIPPVMPPHITARVERIPYGVDAGELLLRSALEANVQGLIIEAARFDPARLELLTAAMAQGISVVVTNPYPTGRLHRDTYRHKGGESHLLDLGFIYAGTTGLKARIKLIVLLSAGLSPERIRELFHMEWE